MKTFLQCGQDTSCSVSAWTSTFIGSTVAVAASSPEHEPDDCAVRNVVEHLSAERQRADAAESPADDTQVEGGDGEAGRDASNWIAHSRSVEDQRPAD